LFEATWANVPSVVLIEVIKLIVNIDRRLDVLSNIDFNRANRVISIFLVALIAKHILSVVVDYLLDLVAHNIQGNTQRNRREIRNPQE
jgi:hypothetical protein